MDTDLEDIGVAPRRDQPGAEDTAGPTLDARARAYIMAHPLSTAGVALVVGALLGGRRRRHRPGLLGLLFAGVGGVALRIARDIAMRRLGESALLWWDERNAMADERDEPFERSPSQRPFETSSWRP